MTRAPDPAEVRALREALDWKTLRTLACDYCSNGSGFQRIHEDSWRQFAKVLASATEAPPVAGMGEDVREALAEEAADQWAGAHFDHLSPSQQQQWHVFRAGVLAAPADECRDAIVGISDDYMTSEAHHPGHVLIPVARFEKLVAAERAALTKPTPPASAANEEAHSDDCGCALCRADAYLDAGLLDTPPASVSGEVVVVPREPTEAMVRAAFDVCEIAPGTSGFATGTDARNAIYRAMLAAAPEAATPSAELGRVSGWNDLTPPYTITHSPAVEGTGRCDESWLLDATKAGKGLTTYPTKVAAQERADEIFGSMPNVVFTIKLFADRTQVGVKATPGTVPLSALNAGIAALEAERADLTNCPAHKAATPSAERIARAVMVWGAPHFKHIVSFNVLVEAIESALAPDKAPSAVGGVDRMREAPLFTAEGIAKAHRETERLSQELDITNADHVALWLEANLGDASLGWLAVRIVEAHEAALASGETSPERGRGE